MTIIKRINKVLSMVDVLIMDNPHDARLRSFSSIFMELYKEFSKPEINKNRISDLSYALSRTYGDSLEYEKTPFGEEVGLIMLDLVKFNSYFV